MVAHEYAHAEAAYRQGDDTAYMLGRLTLNPLPPPGGSHGFSHPLPAGWRLKYRQSYQLGMLPLFLILSLAHALLAPVLSPASALLQLGWSVVGRYALPGGLPASLPRSHPR